MVEVAEEMEMMEEEVRVAVADVKEEEREGIIRIIPQGGVRLFQVKEEEMELEEIKVNEEEKKDIRMSSILYSRDLEDGSGSTGRLEQIATEELFPGFELDEDDNEGMVPVPPPNETAERNLMYKQLEMTVEKESENRRKGNKSKGKNKVYYADLLIDLEAHAEMEGFPKNRLTQIWKLISDPKANLTCSERKKLIFSMVPCEKLEGGIVQNMVYWLEKVGGDEMFKKTVVMSVYQLLNLYTENNLVELNVISNESVLNRIMTTPTLNVVIPWKMRLYRNVCTPKTLTKFHVSRLQALLQKAEIKKTQAGDVQGSLMISQCTPNSWDQDEQSELGVKLRELNYPTGVAERFAVCKDRIQLRMEALPCPIAETVFRECCLPSGPALREKPLGRLIKLLETKEGLVEIALTAELVEVFEKWLQPFIEQKLSLFSGFRSEDVLKYHYLFDVCNLIIEIRRQGFPRLNRWLVDFLITWDFQVFAAAVFKFIPYLQPSDIQGELREPLKALFSTRFRTPRKVRENVWNSLTSLFWNWLDKFTELEYNSDELLEGLKWLHTTLDQCVQHVATCVDFDPEKTFPLTYDILTFYDLLQKECIRSTQLSYFGAVPLHLAALIYLSNSTRILDSAKFLSGSSETDGGIAVDVSVESNRRALDFVRAGLLHSSICGALPPEIVTLKDKADDIVQVNAENLCGLPESMHASERLALWWSGSMSIDSESSAEREGGDQQSRPIIAEKGGAEGWIQLT